MGPPPWAHTHITAGLDEAQHVAFDAAGNVLVAIESGRKQASQEVETLSYKKLTPKGEVLWSTTFNGKYSAAPMGIIADAAGDIFIAGVFEYEGSIGEHVFADASEYDMFLAKLSGADGSVVWAKSFGGLGWDWVQHIATDGTDLLLVATVGESLNFGGPALGPGGAAARLSGADGSHLWSFGWPKTSPLSITVDSKKNIWWGGSYNAAVTIGTTALTPVGRSDALLVKLAANGDVLHAASYGGGWYDRIWGLATDAADAVIAVGAYGPSASFGGEPLGGSEIGSEAGFAAKYDTNGAHVWSKRVQDEAQGVLTSLSRRASPEQFVAVGGQFYGPYIFTFDGAGNTVSVNSTLHEKVSVFDVAAFGEKGVALAGRWEATAVVQGTSLMSQGSTDALITFEP